MKKLLFIFLLLCPQIWGQTLHVDARDVDNIFTTAGEPPSGAPADNDEVQQWDDETLTQWFSNASAPNWRQSVPGLLLPALDFNGTTDFLQLRTTGSVAVTLATIFNNNAKAVLIAIRLDGCAGASAVNPYDNDGIITDIGGYWGIHCYNNGGTPTLQLYNFDGSNDFVSIVVALNTNYIVGMRHDGTNIHGSINCGTETTALSGNTADLTGQIQIARSLAAVFSSVRIGSIKAWDTSNAGGNFATECTTMLNAFVQSGAKKGSLGMMGVGK